MNYKMNRTKIERKKKAIKKARIWLGVLFVFFLLGITFIIINAENGGEEDYEAETIFEKEYEETEDKKSEEKEKEETLTANNLLEGEAFGISYTTWAIGIVGFIIFKSLIRRL